MTSSRPSATSRPSAGRRAGYRVRIVYTEPGFHRKNPHCPSEYTSHFDIPSATSHDHAVREALAEWHYYERHSGVGWRRVIKSVTVEP